MVCSERSFSQPPPASAAPLGETSFEPQAPPFVIRDPPPSAPSRSPLRPRKLPAPKPGPSLWLGSVLPAPGRRRHRMLGATQRRCKWSPCSWAHHLITERPPLVNTKITLWYQLARPLKEHFIDLTLYSCSVSGHAWTFLGKKGKTSDLERHSFALLPQFVFLHSPLCNSRCCTNWNCK